MSLEEAPKCRGGRVAEDCALAHGQYCCEPPSLATQGAVAEGVYTLVYAVKTPRPHPSRDRAPRKAEPGELGRGDHAVLPRGDFCEPLI